MTPLSGLIASVIPSGDTDTEDLGLLFKMSDKFSCCITDVRL